MIVGATNKETSSGSGLIERERERVARNDSAGRGLSSIGVRRCLFPAYCTKNHQLERGTARPDNGPRQVGERFRRKSPCRRRRHVVRPGVVRPAG